MNKLKKGKQHVSGNLFTMIGS